VDQLVRDHRPLPLAVQLAVVAREVVWAPGRVLGITLPLLLLPDGRLRSRRWRVVAAAAVASVAMSVVGGSLLPGPTNNGPIPIDNPFGLGGAAGTGATVVTFTGLVLYAALWLLVPPAAGGESVGQTVLRRPGGRAWIGATLLVVAALLLSGEVGFQRPGIIWALALITIGVLLFRQDVAVGPPPGGGPAGQAGSGQLGQAGPSAGPPAGDPPSGWGAPPPGGWGAPPSSRGAAASPGWAPPPRSRPSPATWGVPPPGGWGVRRPRSILGLLTLAVAVLAIGVAALLDNLGLVQMTVGRSFALFLVVMGLGLVVGAWRGRSVGLVVLGLLLIPLVAAASLADVPFRGGVDDRWIEPQSAAQVRSDYQLGYGRLTLDLSNVKFGKDPTRVQASVGMGELVVYVPPGVPVEARGRSGAGLLELFDRAEGGVQVEMAQRSTGSEEVGRLTLDLRTGYGVVRVLRAFPPGPSPAPDQEQEIG
jgi:hypothetical protein